MIDGVLGRIGYDDNDLCDLTDYRPELAGSPEKFFRVLDKIKDPEKQEWAVHWGVENLFEAGRHDLVVPLVKALGKRTFKSKRLKEEAIRTAFAEGAKRGNQDIVELYCEHLAITSEKYADGLCWSWNNGEPNQVFQFLLEQADQGDLDKAKEKYAGKDYEKFRQAIDKAPKPVPPAGSRHRRPFEKAIAKLAMHALGTALETGMWHQEPGDILASYLVGEEEWAKETGKLEKQKQEAAGETSRGIATEQEGTAEVGSERTD